MKILKPLLISLTVVFTWGIVECFIKKIDIGYSFYVSIQAAVVGFIPLTIIEKAIFFWIYKKSVIKQILIYFTTFLILTVTTVIAFKYFKKIDRY